MVHTATIAEKGFKKMAADFVNRKWSMSMGAPFPPPSLKRQSSSSSSGSFGRRSALVSQGRFSITQCSINSRKLQYSQRLIFFQDTINSRCKKKMCQRQRSEHGMAIMCFGNAIQIDKCINGIHGPNELGIP
jgi:hypothetical protein